MGVIGENAKVYTVILIVYLQYASCQSTDFTHFRIISRKEVTGVFQTNSYSSMVACAVACLNNARASGSCVSTNYNSGSNTCQLSSDNGDNLNTVADDQAFILLPFDVPVCPSPTPLTNGSFTVTGNTVVYSCDAGYSLSGGATMTCVSGSWSGSLPICVIDVPVCPSPTPLANGSFTVTGSTVVYSCDAGYSLSGGATMTCVSGSWPGSMPTCVEDVPVCPSPTPLTNGSFTVTGSTVVYSCDAGYSLSGGGNMTCVSGSWSGSMPTCLEDVPVCPSPTPLTNGIYTVTGSTVVYSCDVGYSLSGIATLTCVGGSWSGSIPTCLVECGTFTNSISNTEVVTSLVCTTESCSLEVQCVIGYKPTPGSTSSVQYVCSSSGTWTGSSSDPDCSYELMFRGTAENGLDINQAYLTGSTTDGATSDVGCMDVHNSSCGLHYRNSRIDSWGSLGISNILYEMYSGGSTVMSIVIDGTGSDMTTWMGNDLAFKAISWPWTDMTPFTTSWWSLFNDIGDGRSFRILENYAYCTDTYFSVVLFEPTHGCSYESHLTWPRFLYSDATGSLDFDTQVYQQASSMAVWVQSTN